MPEEQNRAGDTANNRLVTLLEALGWVQRGDNDIDISCELPQHHDREHPHGVDAYMTYDGPYRAKERGIVIESKTKLWDSTKSSTVKSDANQALKTLECIPESDEFEEYLNFGESRIVDAGILGIWVHDGDFDAKEFNSYVSDIGIENKQRKPFQILVLGNQELNRLASLHAEFSELEEEFDGEAESVDFYYPSLPDSVSDRRSLLSIEYMLSDYVFAKARKVVDNGSGYSRPKDINIVYYFDEINMESLDFMFQALVEYQMLDAEEVHVYIDNRNSEEDFQLQSIRRGFEEEVLPQDSPDFEFRTLPQVSYDSYTDRLRGE